MLIQRYTRLQRECAVCTATSRHISMLWDMLRMCIITVSMTTEQDRGHRYQIEDASETCCMFRQISQVRESDIDCVNTAITPSHLSCFWRSSTTSLIPCFLERPASYCASILTLPPILQTAIQQSDPQPHSNTNENTGFVFIPSNEGS